MSNDFPNIIVRWIINFVDQPTHENHEYWYLTNKSDFTVRLLTKHLRCPGKQKQSKVPCFTIDLLPRVRKRLIRVHMFPFQKYN